MNLKRFSLKIKYFVFIIVFLLSILSCVSLKNISQKIPDYEMINNNDTTEFYEMEISYPVFKSNEYKKLNLEISNYINDQWNKFLVNSVSEIENNSFYLKYSFDISSEIFISEDTVSVVLSLWKFTGGAYGNYLTKTFCFRNNENKIIDIQEASGMQLSEISEICRGELSKQLKNKDPDYTIDQWFIEGTAPDIENYKKFYVNNNVITVIFDPYNVAAYVYGLSLVSFNKKSQ